MAACVVVPLEHLRKGLLQSCSEEGLREGPELEWREGRRFLILCSGQGGETPPLTSQTSRAEVVPTASRVELLQDPGAQTLPYFVLYLLEPSCTRQPVKGVGNGFCCPTSTSEEGAVSCPAAAPEGLMGEFQLVPVSRAVEGAGRCGVGARLVPAQLMF